MSEPAIHRDEQGRPKPPVAGDEVETLLAFLDFHRATVLWKCSGVDGAGMRFTTAASSMTLGGMLKHLAHIEADISARWLHARALGAPWDDIDWAADPDWDWRSADLDTPQELLDLWRAAVARSHALVDEALRLDGLNFRAKGIVNSRGETPTLRYILFALIEAYGRHAGHVDLIREAVDGLTGE